MIVMSGLMHGGLKWQGSQREVGRLLWRSRQRPRLLLRKKLQVNSLKEKLASWNEIKEWAENKTTENFKRSAKLGIEYSKTLKEREKVYHSRNDHILILKYGFPPKKHEKSGKLCADVNDENDTKIPIELFTPNKFPYLIEPNIYHYLLWFRKQFKDIPQETLNQKILQYVLNEHKKTNNLPSFSLQHLDIVWFENPLHLRSYPGISHLHVFWRDTRGHSHSSGVL
ncbi:hypothetical protein RFI_06089 [Reticulomyxa filosa]|uniref:Uncharacterized protein n=1 Tax=Reticulomyxa filosa TaxID=46433 RepID=X6P0H7_RETFI|nr:hypothetical protein RFI_06089 [Reticulomyxa filosa]|eukprot:ETO31032.1 hypothetical protein RFI_06089 [Reticulomyxa filosa]